MCLAAIPSQAAGSDAALVALADRDAPAVLAEIGGAMPGDPPGTQRAYDRARDLMIALDEVRPTAGCRRLAGAARRFALAAVRVPEAVDRLVPARPARARAAAAHRALRSARGGCVPAGAGPAAAPPRGLSPGPGEAFFGTVVADTPAGSEEAEVLLDGRVVSRVAVRRGRARATVTGAPGRHELRVRFLARGIPLGTTVAAGVRLLPAASAVARRPTRPDAVAAARLGAIGRSAGPALGLWVQDLSAGTAAGWNSRTRFPAASTVKLALMVGALARDPATPAAGPLGYEVAQVGGWSSNLAANRLLVALGGSEAGGAAVAQRVLARLGAVDSTYPGGYIVGTGIAGLPPDPARRSVPTVSRRVTTAADLARILFLVHAAATGDRAARAATGLSTRAARVLIAALLASEQRGDNLSLLAPGVPPGTPIAQKNGWIRAARHGAAIIYTPSGPRIAVMLSHSDAGMSLPAARALGARVAAVAAR